MFCLSSKAASNEVSKYIVCTKTKWLHRTQFIGYLLSLTFNSNSNIYDSSSNAMHATSTTGDWID